MKASISRSIDEHKAQIDEHKAHKRAALVRMREIAFEMFDCLVSGDLARLKKED